MSFSFPAASTSIIRGNNFYRIKAQAVDTQNSPLTALGPGDLIPIDVGFKALVVGPESDYEKYELLYTDPTAPGSVQRMPFSKDRPIIGGILSDNAAQYPDSNGELAQAFIRIADNGTIQSSTAGSPAVVSIGEALADIIVYTGEAPNVIPTKRYPKVRSSNVSLEVPVLVPYSFLIPGYGRSFFSMLCNKFLIVGPTVITARVQGIRLYDPLASTTNPAFSALSGRICESQSVVELLAPTVVPNTGTPSGNDTLPFTYRPEDPGSKGYFDMYKVSIETDVNTFPSDANQGQGFRLTLEVRD